MSIPPVHAPDLVLDDDPRFQDTGWRSIPTNPAFPLAGGSLHVRRTGAQVTLRLNGLQLATSTAQPVHFLPTTGTAAFNYPGFRCSASTRKAFQGTRTNAIAEGHNLIVWGSGSNVVLTWYSFATYTAASPTQNTTLPSSTAVTAEVSWVTDEAFPTTLPGTPA